MALFLVVSCHCSLAFLAAQGVALSGQALDDCLYSRGQLRCGQARPHLWNLLKDYQQKRLTSFVNPYEDPRGAGYHILQSLIAIGGGGLNGTGIGKGNQSQGAFIPERHTDFIFAVVGEELGFRITARLFSPIPLSARAPFLLLIKVAPSLPEALWPLV